MPIYMDPDGEEANAFCVAGLMADLLTKVLLAIALALSGEACAASGSVTNSGGETSGYAITSSGYEGNSSGQYTVAWIDDHRVAFTSHGTLLDSGEPRRSGSNDLYIWDTRSGSILKHAESVSGFCYADGFIRYWSGIENEKIVEHSGRIGQEQERVYAVDDFPPRRGWHLNPLTCNRYRREDLPTADGVFFYPLKDGDGYFGGGMAAMSNFTIYLSQGSQDYRRLPVPMRLGVVVYSEMTSAYVLRETPPILIKDRHVPIRFWLFRAEAFSLKPIVIPAGPWLKGYISLVAPTRRGVVFASATAGPSDRSGRPTTGAGGIYLLANDRLERVMAGYPYSVSINPGGCKVVVSITSRFMAGKRATVKFVNVCEKER